MDRPCFRTRTPPAPALWRWFAKPRLLPSLALGLLTLLPVLTFGPQLSRPREWVIGIVENRYQRWFEAQDMIHPVLLLSLAFGGGLLVEHLPLHLPISCEAATDLAMLDFPAARPLVMDARRTFLEKAAAIHVACRKGRWGSGEGDRYSRHWDDLDRLARAGIAAAAIRDRPLAVEVAQHKEDFWRATDADGQPINDGQVIKTASCSWCRPLLPGRPLRRTTGP